MALVSVFAQMALIGITCAFYMLDTNLGFTLGRGFVFLSLIIAVPIFAIGVTDLRSYSSPITPASTITVGHNEGLSIPKFNLQEILTLFSFHTNSTSIVYTNGKIIPFFGAFIPIIIQIAPTIVAWRLLTPPSLTLIEGGLRSLEWTLTLAPITNGVSAWGILELTLFARHKTRSMLCYVTVFTTHVLTFPVSLLFLPN